MNNRMATLFAILFVVVLSANSHASYVDYRIIFAPNDDIEGSFSIENSIVGSNQTYDYFMPTGLLKDFIINYSGGVYNYDPIYTRNIGLPSFPYVISTGPAGDVIDIKGALTMAGTFNEFFLGRESLGTFQFIKQINSANSLLAFSGTYSIERVSEPVPIPAAVWLLGSGLIGLVGARRRFYR